LASSSIAGKLDFTVNGKEVTYDLTANASQTIGQFMSSLSAQSGVNFSYSELTGKFSMATTGTGSSQSLTIDTASSSSQGNSQTILNSMFSTNLSGTTDPTTAQTFTGSNGSFTITEPNGGSNTISESSNQFVIDGISYNFTSNMNNGSQISSSNPVTLGVTVNTDNVVNQVQNFVNDYNNLIGGIQDALNEKRNYSYSPLTTMQESQMTTAQITAWNQQAQQGLLANDDDLTNMLTSMREAFYKPVYTDSTETTTIPLTMASIGLSTSDDPTQGGKLTLNTQTLTTALQNNPQQVINLLAQIPSNSSYSYYNPTLTSSQLTSRNNEEGIFQRLSDIVQEYVGTGFNSNGQEGILLTKAGMANDLSDSNNSLTTQIKQQQQSVTDYLTKFNQDKTRYTTMFTQLQSAMSQISTQQSYISSLTSSSSSG
jgi:flagellar hook-associated protein 2